MVPPPALIGQESQGRSESHSAVLASGVMLLHQSSMWTHLDSRRNCFHGPSGCKQSQNHGMVLTVQIFPTRRTAQDKTKQNKPLQE